MRGSFTRNRDSRISRSPASTVSRAAVSGTSTSITTGAPARRTKRWMRSPRSSRCVAPGATWISESGSRSQLVITDILVVSPFNAQVSRLSDRLPTGARVGTVDKFQGQAAPIVIYSMASSSPEDAPRGMEFLYSLNRLNVATSRAKCAVVIVANPRLYSPECKTPRQMKLANALCRYREMAKVVSMNL